MNHTRNEIKCGDFCVCFFKQYIINRQERYSFRATSCTLRFTTKSRTERYLILSGISDFVQQVARYAPRPNHARNEIKCGDFCVCFFRQDIIHCHERYSFRATSCTLRFMISCVAWIQTEATCLTLQGHYDLSRINTVER